VSGRLPGVLARAAAPVQAVELVVAGAATALVVPEGAA
jgi:hypothetical protein